MTATKDNKPARAPELSSSPSDISSSFKLETVFEDISQIFKPHRVNKASEKDVLIAVDTNVLLLPYTIRKEGLPTLQEFYKKIKAEGRLFLPARVAREFIGNRDRKLAELLKTLGDIKSRINIGETRLSPILVGVEGSEQLTIASKALAQAKEQYTAAIGLLEDKVRSWSGDDPVTKIYGSVFEASNIVSPAEGDRDIFSEWTVRRREQIPPGYKDSAKADTGIGDFLIWKSLLHLGAKEKKRPDLRDGRRESRLVCSGERSRRLPKAGTRSRISKILRGKEYPTCQPA